MKGVAQNGDRPTAAAAFSIGNALGYGWNAMGTEMADINNDGSLDVLGLAHPGEWKQAAAPTEIYWFQNPRPKGDPTRDGWTPHRIGQAPAFVKDLRLADFNGDGARDLATVNSGFGDVSILLGNGDGTFAAQTFFEVGGRTPSPPQADANEVGQPSVARGGGHDAGNV